MTEVDNVDVVVLLYKLRERYRQSGHCFTVVV